MGCRHPAYGRLQMCESPFDHHRCNVAGHSTSWISFIDNDEPTCLGDTFKNAVLVERRRRARINDRRLNPLCRQCPRRLHSWLRHACERHYGNVAAIAQNCRLTERNTVGFRRYLAFDVI